MTISEPAGRSEPPRPPTAAQWFQDPIQSIAVKLVGQFSPTADGACRVELPCGSIAYVKPRPDKGAKNLLVAREKISADLGYLLELPVAPVVVRSPEPQIWPNHSVLSLAILPSARQWGTGGQHHITAVAERLETLRVFWTWIGDHDHGNRGGNVLFAVKGDGCNILSIDHSWSLCHGNQNHSLEVGVSAGYGTEGMDGAAGWRRAAYDKILSLDWSKVENVVQRLQAILTADEQAKILRILKERREHLAQFFGF